MSELILNHTSTTRGTTIVIDHFKTRIHFIKKHVTFKLNFNMNLFVKF